MECIPTFTEEGSIQALSHIPVEKDEAPCWKQLVSEQPVYFWLVHVYIFSSASAEGVALP